MQAHLLPGLGRVGLARRIDGRLEQVQLDERGCQATPVGDVLEDDARRIEETLLEAPIADALQIGLVRSADELLQRANLACLSVCIDQLRVHLQTQERFFTLAACLSLVAVGVTSIRYTCLTSKPVCWCSCLD